MAEERFHCIPEAGRFPWIEQPRRVRASLRASIAALGQGARLSREIPADHSDHDTTRETET
jgi:hypothetical protein